MTNPLTLLGDLAKLASRLPPEVIKLLIDVVKAVSDSNDPVRAARLAALAAASKTATEKAIEEALRRRKR